MHNVCQYRKYLVNSSQKTYPCQKVTLLLPKSGLHKWEEQGLVGWRKLGTSVEGQQLREQLEDIGSELDNILLENDLEGLEQEVLELSSSLGRGSADETDQGTNTLKDVVVELGVTGVSAHSLDNSGQASQAKTDQGHHLLANRQNQTH